MKLICALHQHITRFVDIVCLEILAPCYIVSDDYILCKRSPSNIFGSQKVENRIKKAVELLMDSLIELSPV